jgi:hypothetical protein
MNDEEMLLLVGGAALLLFLISRGSAANAALNANAITALNNSGLTAAQIAANQKAAQTASIVGGVSSLVGAAGSAIANNSGGSNYTQYASYTS